MKTMPLWTGCEGVQRKLTEFTEGDLGERVAGCVCVLEGMTVNRLGEKFMCVFKYFDISVLFD